MIKQNSKEKHKHKVFLHLVRLDSLEKILVGPCTFLASLQNYWLDMFS